MTYSYTVLLEPDIKYTILSEDGTPVYVTFSLPRSESAHESNNEVSEYMNWTRYNTYTGYAVIALNVITIAIFAINTVYGEDIGEQSI